MKDIEKMMLNDREFYASEIRKIIHSALKSTISGSFSQHQEFPVYKTKHIYTQETLVEGLTLFPDKIPDVVIKWAKMDPNIAWSLNDLLIIDLETTGLGRGGGMVAFLIGVGYYEQNQYITEQFFLPEPEAEVNSFDFINELLQRKSVLVTFNGKSFDIPILKSRFLHNHLWIDINSKEHIDLLLLARRLWKNKVPSCALETLEYYILGQTRDKELDIEGSLIPQTYFQFLINGDPELIRRIFIHNQNDILHTAALLSLICEHIDYPFNEDWDIRLDYHAVAKLYLSQGYLDVAQTILEDLLRDNIINKETAYELGMIYKRQKDVTRAAQCFQIASELNFLPAMLELLTILERKTKQYDEAMLLGEKIKTTMMQDSYKNAHKIQSIETKLERIQGRVNNV